MTLKISVIICSHNPRKDYLAATIEGLRLQTLPIELWELILIDNASDIPLTNSMDLTWHRQSRIMAESKLGLTNARLCGIKNSTTEIIVFVDDDNVLDCTYLENVLKIAEQWPILGAWGGQIVPQFEVEPPEWTRPYWPMLAVREINKDLWSNLGDDYTCLPCGAGLVVRREVAMCYAKKIARDQKRLSLDRKGNDLTSAGDSDLALTARDIGLGTGLFVNLRLTHLIPPNRLTEEYLLKLAEKMEFSSLVLKSIRTQIEIPLSPTLPWKMIDWIILLRMDRRSRQFVLARRRGASKALQVIYPVTSSR